MARVKSVIPAPPNSDEEPFKIGDEITVFDAAMIYAGRHPHPRFLKDGSLEDHWEFLRAGIPQREPRSAVRRDAQLSWDIYCELVRRLERGQINAVRTAYSGNEIDPVRTIIRTSDVAVLATERGEQPQYLEGHLLSGQQRKNGAQRMRRTDAVPKRRSYKRERAMEAIKALWPDGVPDQGALPNKALCKKVAEWIAKDQRTPRIEISDDTIQRAAGRSH
jgi:hypothetical protein